MRHVFRLVLLTLALPVLYLMASVVLPLIPGPGPDLSGSLTRQIGLLQGPIHTDILFPLTPETRTRFAFAEAAGVPLNHPDARWLVFGWGSAAFYTSAGTYADITASAVLTAATGDDAVIRLDALGPLPPLENLRFLRLSEAQFQALIDQTSATFTSEIPLAQPGFTGTDAFFPAHGHFSIFRTCNAWLGQTLRAAGIRFGLWTPANWSVTLSLNRHLSGQTW
ncbi:MAG: TIGR02117 family protein [Rhodobacterales bacterium]|nr:TIGR02117 family protein [Rhodobacterales bacterium]